MADQRKTLQPLIAELEAELRETETVGPEAEMERLESELRVLKAVDLDVEEANLQEKLKASKAAMESNKGALAEKQGIVEALEGSIITLQGQLQEAEAKAAAPVVDDPSTTPEQEEAERLQAELKATELARQIAEARAEELQLELEERELTAAEARAAKEASEAQAGPSRVKEYQSAIQALNKMSMEEKGRLERRLGELERDAGTKARLKRQVEDLTHEKKTAEDKISSLDKYAVELGKLSQAGAALEDAHASATAEMRRELEICDRRVGQLEDLVLKLDRDRLLVERATAEEAKKAADLTQQLKALVDMATQDSEAKCFEEMNSKIKRCGAIVRAQVGKLGSASWRACAQAYLDCIPPAWTGQLVESAMASVDQARQAAGVEGLPQTLASASQLIVAALSSLPAQAKEEGSVHEGMSEQVASCMKSCAEVQLRVSSTFTKQSEVAEAQKALNEQKTSLGQTEIRLERSTAHTAQLRKELDDMRKKAEAVQQMIAETATLRKQAKEDRGSQTAKEQELEDAKESCQTVMSVKEEAERVVVELKQELVQQQKNPHADKHGRVTPQQLSMLRRTAEKSSRELYARKVSEVLQLPTLLTPTRAAAPAAGAGAGAGAHLAKHVELRKEVLLEWAGARLTRLSGGPGGSATTTGTGVGLNDPMQQQQQHAATMHRLQMDLAVLKGQLQSIQPSDSQAGPTRQQQQQQQPKQQHRSPTQGSSPALEIKMQVPCPHWASVQAPHSGPLSVSFKELAAIHAGVLL